jgi:hypothetical protein
MIPQNPMYVIHNKVDGKYMNAATGATGEGPATIFKDHKAIDSFIYFYQGPEFDFEIIEVELKVKGVVTLDEVKARKKLPKKKRK